MKTVANPKITYKMIVIGRASSGKTSIVRKFCSNAFSNNYNTTVGIEFDSKEIKVDDQSITLQIWDTVVLLGWSGEVQGFNQRILCQHSLCFAGLFYRWVSLIVDNPSMIWPTGWVILATTFLQIVYMFWLAPRTIWTGKWTLTRESNSFTKIKWICSLKQALKQGIKFQRYLTGQLGK